MTKNESKLLSIQGIAKASAFCLLLSAFSVNAAMAAPAPAGTVDEVMAVQQGKKVTGVVVDGTGEPVIGANVVVKGTTNGTITDFDGNYTIEGVPADGVLVISYIGYLSQDVISNVDNTLNDEVLSVFNDLILQEKNLNDLENISVFPDIKITMEYILKYYFNIK